MSDYLLLDGTDYLLLDGADRLVLESVPVSGIPIRGSVNFFNSARVRLLWPSPPPSVQNIGTATGLDFNTVLPSNISILNSYGAFSGISTGSFQNFYYNTNPASPTLICDLGTFSFYMESVSYYIVRNYNYEIESNIPYAGSDLFIQGLGYFSSTSTSPVYNITPGSFSLEVIGNRYGTGVSEMTGILSTLEGGGGAGRKKRRSRKEEIDSDDAEVMQIIQRMLDVLD